MVTETATEQPQALAAADGSTISIDAIKALLKISRITLTADERALRVKAQAIVIEDADTYVEAGQLLLKVKATRKRIVAWYDAFKKPINAIHGIVQAMLGDDVAIWSRIEQTLGQEWAQWKIDADKEAARLALEEQLAREAQAQADRDAQAAAVTRVAEATEDPGVAASLHEEARAIAAQPVLVDAPKMQSAAPNVAGLSATLPLTATVTGKVELVRHLLKLVDDKQMTAEQFELAVCIESKWISAQLKANGKDLKLPGVTVGYGAPRSSGRT